MLILAHRGFHAATPENTMEAFDCAIKLDVDGIETDVRQTRDRELVLIHDRVIKGGLLVSQLTKSELEQQLSHAVPGLEEALSTFPNIFWNIEVKTRDALENSIKVLKKFQTSHRIFISSFLHDVVVDCATRLGFECGLLMASRPTEMDTLIAQYKNFSDIRTVVWDFNVLDQTQVAELASAGWHNFAYGPVTLEEHRYCSEIGLDMVITDYPQRAL